MNTAPTAATPAPRPNATLAAAVVSQGIAAAGFIALGLLAPDLAKLTGLDERDFGLSITFFFIGTALSSPLSGVLARRLGGVGTLVLVKCIMAGGYLVCLAGTWPAMMLAAFLFGIGYGPIGPVSMTIVTQRTPVNRRGLALAVRQAAQPLASAIIARVLPPLMAYAGWQAGVYSVTGLLLFGALFVILAAPLFRVDLSDKPASAPEFSVSRMLTTLLAYIRIPPELRLLWSVGLVFAMTQMAMLVFAYLYLLEVVGLSAITAGIFVSNQQLAGMIGRPLFGWFCDVTGRSGYVLGAIALMTCVVIVAFLSVTADMPAWQLIILAVATGFSGQTWNSVFTTAMSYKVAPGQLVEMNGRAFSFLSLGWMAAPMLFWSLIELSGGYLLAFLVVLVANAVAALALFAFGGETDRREA